MQKRSQSLNVKMQRQKASNCFYCQRNFSLLLKQHQCKRCLQPICRTCGSQKAFIPAYDHKHSHRICKQCLKDQIQIKDQIAKQSKIIFGQNSILTTKWMGYIKKNMKYSTNEKEMKEEFEVLLNKNQEIYNNQQICNLIAKERLNWNHSIEEFDYYVTQNISNNVLNNVVSQLLVAYLAQNEHYQLNDLIVQLATFLCYFNSPYCALHILNYLTINFIPNKQLNLISCQKITFLCELAKQNYLMDAQEILILQKFYEIYSLHLIKNIFFNFLNFSCQLYLMEHYIKFNSFYECEKTLVGISYLFRNDIKQKVLNQDYLFERILNSTDQEQIKEILLTQDRFSFKENYKSFQEIQLSQAEQQNNLLSNSLKYITDSIIGTKTKELPQNLNKEQYQQLQFIVEYIENQKANEFVDKIQDFQSPFFGAKNKEFKDSFKELEQQNETQQINIEQEQQQKNNQIKELQQKLKNQEIVYKMKLQDLAKKQQKQIEQYLGKQQDSNKIETKPQLQRSHTDQEKKKNEECLIF